MNVAAPSELKVGVVQDHDGECSVTVTMTSGPFSGCGHAWLYIEELSKFVTSVKQLAQTSTGEAKLRGGYFNADGSPHPTINLRLLPHGRRGHILIAADLATDPPDQASDIGFVQRMSGSLIVEPAALDTFAALLSKIEKGAEVEAVVPGKSAA